MVSGIAVTDQQCLEIELEQQVALEQCLQIVESLVRLSEQSIRCAAQVVERASAGAATKALQILGEAVLRYNLPDLTPHMSRFLRCRAICPSCDSLDI